MTKAWKLVWALGAALAAGQSALAQPELAPDNIVPAVGRARAISAPQMPSDDPTPFAPSPFLSREFAPDLPTAYPNFQAPADPGPLPMSAGPTGPQRIMPFVDVELGYSLVMYKKQALSLPSLTAGLPSDAAPGAFGGKNTYWLFSRPGGDEIPINGGRLRIATWLPSFEMLSAELIGWIPEPQTLSAINASASTPGLAISRPIFDPLTGAPAAIPVAVPNIFSSVSSDAFRTSLMGMEANLRYNFRDTWSGLVGFRYLRVDESYKNRDDITNLINGTDSTFQDNFTTYNRFVGPQFGVLYNSGKSVAELDFFAKVAVGVNQQTAIVSGSSVFADPLTGAPIVDPTKGTYAQPTNIGRYRNSGVAFIPEVGINFHYAIGPNCRLGAGYSALLFTEMIRPSGQIDYTVNVQPIQNVVLPPLVPTPPSFQQTEFWIQTVNFTLEYVF